MTTIVERCREWAASYDSFETAVADLLREAADELERLREALEKIYGHGESYEQSMMAKEVLGDKA